jgi:hypothetical protein
LSCLKFSVDIALKFDLNLNIRKLQVRVLIGSQEPAKCKHNFLSCLKFSVEIALKFDLNFKIRDFQVRVLIGSQIPAKCSQTQLLMFILLGGISA